MRIVPFAITATAALLSGPSSTRGIAPAERKTRDRTTAAPRRRPSSVSAWQSRSFGDNGGSLQDIVNGFPCRALTLRVLRGQRAVPRRKHTSTPPRFAPRAAPLKQTKQNSAARLACASLERDETYETKSTAA